MKAAVTIALLAGALAASDTLHFDLVKKEVIEERLKSFTHKNSEREPAMRALFEQAGCASEALSEQTVKGVKAPNLICTLSGETDSRVIVGAHFDLVEKGDGVVDNWSGASLLPSFYEGLSKDKRKHTFVFVAFTGEEIGELGSKAFVKQLKKDQWQVPAMVNLDTLGLGETKIWLSHSDRNLATTLIGLANQLHYPIGGVNVEQVGSTDSESFREAKIPAITIHSLTQETWPILHSPKDNMDAMRLDEYFDTYKLVQTYLAYLDQKLD